MPQSRRHLFVLLLGLAVLAGACGGKAQPASVVTASPKPPLSYAAVGASETVGRGADKPATEGWPKVFAAKLGEGGRQITFNGLGFDGASVEEALASSVPKVEKLQPNLVSVWLNVNDLVRFVTAPAYEKRMTELVHRLRRGGAATVLVANTPAVDHLPAYLDCLDPAGTRCLLAAELRPLVPKPDVLNVQVDAYNQATARIVRQEGAVLVDLHAASLKARAEGREASLVSSDGFHPSTAGHAAVAATFAEAAVKAGV